MGVLLIFIYYQKLIRLYRFQQNFINGFTHELKTPIASLRLYLDTFNKYDLNKDDTKKYISYMIKDTERLNLNVNQILNLSKLEDRSFLPDFDSEDLHYFTEEFFRKNPHYFEECDITIEKKSQGDYPFFFDFKLFEMVIMNLVTNCIKHNKNKWPQLKIIFSKHGKNYLIDFEDNGVGLDKSEFKNIFKKSYQVGKTTKGSGLGLYLAQSIVKIHKGEMSATSEGLGQGTRFRIKLPMK